MFLNLRKTTLKTQYKKSNYNYLFHVINVKLKHLHKRMRRVLHPKRAIMPAFQNKNPRRVKSNFNWTPSERFKHIHLILT
ncbi:MAG: hypothetical protein EBU32_05690 [Opitutaceae bacterium]|nr:hypothetical protein [Opitutaceae bacterium]